MKQQTQRARIVDRTELAAFFNVTERRVHQLVREGMPRRARGNYELDRCVRWYVRYLQAVLSRRAISTDPGENAALRFARVRKLRGDGDLKELELDRQRARLVAASDVEKALRDLATMATARILAIAPRLAPELLGETSRMMLQAKIEKALREALKQLAANGRPAGLTFS